MSDTKIFDIAGGTASEIIPQTIQLEKELQIVFEKNLETILAVRLLASEFSTTHGGRMDTLGIDEDNCPVIIEYKRNSSENVINQGLFYLDWLMDHKAEFELLVRDRFGKKTADEIAWGVPRLICVAKGFSKYDVHAVKQINRNIELVRFEKFENEILLIELLTANSTTSAKTSSNLNGNSSTYKTVTQYLEQSDDQLKSLFGQIRDALLSLGDDIQEKTLKNYFAFKRLRNFACVEVKPNEKKILVYLKVDLEKSEFVDGFSRDVQHVGHFGTGHLELTLRSEEDLEKAKDFFQLSHGRGLYPHPGSGAALCSAFFGQP